MIYLSINRSKGKNQIVLFIDLEKKFDLKIHFGLSQMGSETLLEVISQNGCPWRTPSSVQTFFGW